MKVKTIFWALLFTLVYLTAFMFIHKLLQQPSVYNNFFSGFMPSYEVQDNLIVVVDKPFVPLSEKSFVENMDAHHYSHIKNNLYNYDPNDEVSRSNFAFFPLFPIVWKFSLLSGIGISVLNFLLHFISMIILVGIFCKNNIRLSLLVIFSLPTLTVFLIPYSEGLFMFSVGLALVGWKKENRFLYIMGLVMASMTRPVFILLIAGCIATEIYLWLTRRKKKIDRKHLIVSVASLLGGTLLVTLFQRMFHHGSLLTFIHAQKHWGTYLRLPETIVDWSNEGYAMNVWAMGFCVVFGLSVLIYGFFNKSSTHINVFGYWYYFSWIYMLLAVLFVLFLQGGCLHSLYRYTLCTPFFYIIIFHHLNADYRIPSWRLIVLFIMCIISCLIFFNMANYGKVWSFSRTGFVLLSIALLFFILSQRLARVPQYALYSLLIVAGIIWNCYLLNMFVSRAWIFL